MTSVVIVSAVRTAVGKFGGALAGHSAVSLGAVVIREALARTRMDPARVDEVIMGQVLAAGCGQNPARQSALGAGLPEHVPAMTINKVCGSGLKAVALAAQAITAGDAAVIVAGSEESMSQAPHVLPGSRDGWRMGDVQAIDSISGPRPVFAKDGGVTAANASGLNDGAAAVLVMSESCASALGLEPLARIHAYASAGLDPAFMELGSGPHQRQRRCHRDRAPDRRVGLPNSRDPAARAAPARRPARPRLALHRWRHGGIGTAISQRLCKSSFNVIAGCGPGSPRKDRWLAEMHAQGYEVYASEGNVSNWDSTRATACSAR